MRRSYSPSTLSTKNPLGVAGMPPFSSSVNRYTIRELLPYYRVSPTTDFSPLYLFHPIYGWKYLEYGMHRLLYTIFVFTLHLISSYAVVEAAERFAYYGLSSNLIMYLTNYLHQPTAIAAKNINTWVGVSSLFALLGAIVADSFLGRFKTIIFSTSIYFMVSFSPNSRVSQLY
jgi:hypothetical protein